MCKLYIVHFIVKTLQCTAYSVKCTVSIYSITCSVHSTEYCAYCTVYDKLHNKLQMEKKASTREQDKVVHTLQKHAKKFSLYHKFCNTYII